MRVGGIVLCGGRSSRMGRPKALLPFGPEAMLQRVLRLLGEVVEPLVVVAGAHQDLPDLPARTLVASDRNPGRGPLEGLRAGLEAIGGRADAAYATSCDVPLLAPRFVRRMIELLGPHAVAVPADGPFQHPLAAVYRLTVLPAIESLLAAERLRPVYLYDTVDTLRVPLEQLRDVDPQLGTLTNLNRPEDYLAALRASGFEPPDDLRRGAPAAPLPR